MKTRFDGHTPGPWKWKEPSDRCSSDMAELHGANDKVCDFGSAEAYYPIEGTEPSDIDKKLIAAAPSLLALAQELRRALQFAKSHARLQDVTMADGEAMGWGSVDKTLAHASAILDAQEEKDA